LGRVCAPHNLAATPSESSPRRDRGTIDTAPERRGRNTEAHVDSGAAVKLRAG